MPTVARNVEAETRRAWAEYADTLRGLEGAEYDRAEEDAWRRLQDTLDDVRDAAALDRRPVG
jgi:hypothetical protein